MATSRVVNGDDLHAAVRNAKLLSKNTKKQLFGVLLVKPNVGVDGVEDYLVYQFCTTLVYHFNSVTQKPPPPRAVHRRASGCSSWIKKEGDYRGCLCTRISLLCVLVLCPASVFLSSVVCTAPIFQRGRVRSAHLSFCCTAVHTQRTERADYQTLRVR